MTMHPVESGTIAAIGHDPEANKLRVRFKKGATYEYENLSADGFAAFMDSESKGKYFGAFIQNKPQHPCRKLSEEEAKW